MNCATARGSLNTIWWFDEGTKSNVILLFIGLYNASRIADFLQFQSFYPYRNLKGKVNFFF